jgi:hypothetical protein
MTWSAMSVADRSVANSLDEPRDFAFASLSTRMQTILVAGTEAHLVLSTKLNCFLDNLARRGPSLPSKPYARGHNQTTGLHGLPRATQVASTTMVS